MDSNIVNLLVALIPSIVGCLGIGASVITCIHKLKDLKDKSLEENAALKKKITQALEVNINVQRLIEEYVKKIEELELKIYDLSTKENEKINEIVEQNTRLVHENHTIAYLTEELTKIKAQLTALLKKGE